MKLEPETNIIVLNSYWNSDNPILSCRTEDMTREKLMELFILFGGARVRFNSPKEGLIDISEEKSIYDRAMVKAEPTHNRKDYKILNEEKKAYMISEETLSQAFRDKGLAFPMVSISECELGDEVIILREDYGWGEIKPMDVGKVSGSNRIDFPTHSDWGVSPGLPAIVKVKDLDSAGLSLVARPLEFYNVNTALIPKEDLESFSLRVFEKRDLRPNLISLNGY